MGYFTSPLVTECLGMDPLLADTIGVALLILIVVAILKVMFGNTPERMGASEMRPNIGGYQPRKTPPDPNSMPPGPKVRPPPPKPIPSRGCTCCAERRRLQTGEQLPTAEELLSCAPVPPNGQVVYEGLKPKPPLRRCPSKGFGESIECGECERQYNCPKKD